MGASEPQRVDANPRFVLSQPGWILTMSPHLGRRFAIFRQQLGEDDRCVYVRSTIVAVCGESVENFLQLSNGLRLR